MGLTTAEKIKIVLKRRKMTMGELAEKTNQTRQNLSNKMARNNFPEKELKEIAEALDCELETTLIMKDTGERTEKKRLWLMKGGYTWTILIMENVVFAANIKNLLLNTFRLNLRLTLLKQKLFPE